MRILFVSVSYSPRVGGLETFLGHLVRAFLERKHTVKVITRKYPRTLKGTECIDGVEVARYHFFDPSLPVLRLRAIAAYIYMLLLAPVNLLKFIFFIKRFQPDVINYHFVGAPTFFLLVYLCLVKTKLVVSLHGTDVESLHFASKTYKILSKSILKKASAITANSYHVLNLAAAVAPFIKEKSKVIYNAINTAKFEKIAADCSKKKYILAIGRLVETKGFDILIKACQGVFQQVKDTNLIIVGDGPEKNNLQELVQKLCLENKIRFYGWAKQEKIVKLLKGCEFFVLPSRREAFGVVLLEAMACKKAVIATRSGGPQEIIENEINGLLVEKENGEELAAAIKRLCNDSFLLKELSDNSYKTLERFNMELAQSQYLGVFRQ